MLFRSVSQSRYGQVLVYAIKKAIEKYNFKLYGLCIMSNHIHYLIEPKEPQDLPKIMHWLNWYTALCFNQMLNRTGHFWEKRYHSTGFLTTDRKRALNTLRYIHAILKQLVYSGECFMISAIMGFTRDWRMMG